MPEYLSHTIAEGIAHVILDAPDGKVNILNQSFLEDLEATARQLAKTSGVRAAVVSSAKEGGFIAGADVKQIQAVTDPAEGERLAREGQRIFGLWADLRFPVVAAVHGHCMGGGTEFILACHARIVAENAAIALPEIKLGLFPGFGGTQRLPRLISLEKSLDIILSGRSVRAREAEKIGLADRCVPLAELKDAALDLARDMAADGGKIKARRERKRGGLRTWLLEKNPLGRAVLFRQAQKNVQAKTAGHYPAPSKALQVIREGIGRDLQSGLDLEARELGHIVVTPVCKNLIHVFFLNQRAKKAPGLDAKPRELAEVAVLGGGVMGRGIAYLFADNTIPVVIRDLKEGIIAQALADIRKKIEKRARKRHQGQDAVDKKMKGVRGTTELNDLAGASLAIEAVLEKMEVKKSVLREIEPVVGEETVFATNTSALSVSELQQAAQRPHNVGGLHFFNPAEKMPLVEVIRGEQTSEQTLATLFDAALKLGKTPIVTADRPGFLVNRLLVAYLNEACLIAQSGVDWHSLDVRATSFGLPMGPFRLIDEVGLDIAAEVGDTLSQAFSYLKKSSLLEQAGNQPDLGRKTGKGFYLYRNGAEAGRNEQLAGALGLLGARQATRDDLRRMLLLMVNEAGRCLEEGVVAEAADVDTGMIFGTGFPPFLGGLCRWADHCGLKTVVADLEKLAANHGPRFTPATFLKENESFYQKKN